MPNPAPEPEDDKEIRLVVAIPIRHEHVERVKEDLALAHGPLPFKFEAVPGNAAARTRVSLYFPWESVRPSIEATMTTGLDRDQAAINVLGAILRPAEKSSLTMSLIMYEIFSDKRGHGPMINFPDPPVPPVPKKADRQTLLEAARNLKWAYQQLKDMLPAGSMTRNLAMFNNAEDAWCRIEEFEQLVNERQDSFVTWEGADAYPTGMAPDTVVEVNLRDGSIRAGFRSDFDWMAGDMPDDIVSYRWIGDIVSRDLNGD